MIAMGLAVAAQASLALMWLHAGAPRHQILALVLALMSSVVVLGLGAAVLTLLGRARSSQDELKLMSTTDPMTGALNRRAFAGRAAQEYTRTRRYDRPLSVLAISADTFATIKDAHGAEEGAFFLQSLISAWQSALRTTDAIGRVADDHFAVLLPETSGSRAHELARRVRQATNELRFDFLDASERASISIGVASVETADSGIEHALARADQALREARNAGGSGANALTETAS
ncbi:MAG: GGDEF domain-containing protein [Pseudomonadota bacterium]|nr:GGDEF domain-containing protein [Pseudomonadota bacterium]